MQQHVTSFFHRKEDFYAVAESGRVPEYDVMITNPPYRYTICGGKFVP
jgi:hypothetical protein